MARAAREIDQSLGCDVHLVPPNAAACPTWFSPPMPGWRSGSVLSRAIFATRNAPAKRRFSRSGWKNTATKSSGCRRTNIFEGEGDALFAGDVLFCGYKFRTDVDAHRTVAEILNCLVISVELVDPRFYHIDTCFCPLTDGGAFWFPAAFDEYGQRAIRDHVPNLIDVAEEEAAHFSCNAVVLEKEIVLPQGAPKLVESLDERGFTMSSAADDRVPQSRRRLQMSDDVHAATGDGLALSSAPITVLLSSPT